MKDNFKKTTQTILEHIRGEAFVVAKTRFVNPSATDIRRIQNDMLNGARIALKMVLEMKFRRPAIEESQRRDEKRGLYGNKVDIAN